MNVSLSQNSQVVWKRAGCPNEEHDGDLHGESDGSQPFDTLTDDSEARNDFWTIAGNYVSRHHVEPRVKLYVPNEESFPTPLENIDVVRRTNTTLDVLLEAVLTIVGTLMVAGIYRSHGLVSRSSQH